MHGRELYATSLRKQRREATIRESRSVRLQMDEYQDEGNQDSLFKVNPELTNIFITDVRCIKTLLGR